MSFDFIEYLTNIWKEEYLIRKKTDYFESPKDKKAMGQLLVKFKKKHPNNNSEETCETIRSYFREVLQIQDSYYSKNITLTLLNSKINEIHQYVLELRKVRKQQKNDKETAEDLKKVGKLYEKEIGGAFKLWPNKESNYKPPFMTKLQYLREHGASRIDEYENDYKKRMADK